MAGHSDLPLKELSGLIERIRLIRPIIGKQRIKRGEQRRLAVIVGAEAMAASKWATGSPR
jgi:hypothetical protein